VASGTTLARVDTAACARVIAAEDLIQDLYLRVASLGSPSRWNSSAYSTAWPPI